MLHVAASSAAAAACDAGGQQQLQAACGGRIKDCVWLRTSCNCSAQKQHEASGQAERGCVAATLQEHAHGVWRLQAACQQSHQGGESPALLRAVLNAQRSTKLQAPPRR